MSDGKIIYDPFQTVTILWPGENFDCYTVLVWSGLGSGFYHYHMGDPNLPNPNVSKIGHYYNFFEYLAHYLSQGFKIVENENIRKYFEQKIRKL